MAGDHLVEEYGGRKAKQSAEQEMTLIKGLETTIADARDKCEALWGLITKGDETIASRLMAAGDAKLAENAS